MKPRLIMVFAAAALAVWAVRAAAQPRPAVEVGAEVRAADGATLGRIEGVVEDTQGRPQQVLVRARGLAGAAGQVKSLPISALKPASDGYAVALRKSEFDLLPPVKGR